MRFFFLALAVLFPSVATAQSPICPDEKERQNMLDTVGTGENAIENAIKFYSDIYGAPTSVKRFPPDGVALQWIVPTQGLPIARNIGVKIGIDGKPVVGCDLTF